MGIITLGIMHSRMWLHIVQGKIRQFLQGKLKVDEFGETDKGVLRT